MVLEIALALAKADFWSGDRALPAEDVGREEGADDRAAIGMLVTEGTSPRHACVGLWSISAASGSGSRACSLR